MTPTHPCPPWNQDQAVDSDQLEANGAAVVAGILAQARLRNPPSIAVIQQCHVDLLENTFVPHEEYRGGFRGDVERPCLQDYEVAVWTESGPLRGVNAADVAAQLRDFQAELARRCSVLDEELKLKPVLSASDEIAILQLAAWAHGEWIRIHPFANGNGRTARLWVAWVCGRYDLELFLSVRPRPRHPDFGVAAGASMVGDHSAMLSVFLDMLIWKRFGMVS